LTNGGCSKNFARGGGREDAPQKADIGTLWRKDLLFERMLSWERTACGQGQPEKGGWGRGENHHRALHQDAGEVKQGDPPPKSGGWKGKRIRVVRDHQLSKVFFGESGWRKGSYGEGREGNEFIAEGKGGGEHRVGE